MKKHRIVLQGPGAKGPAVSAQVLVKVLDLLVKSCKGATRLRLDGRSSAPGAAPAWLARVSDFTVNDLQEGSVAIELSAKSIGQLAPLLVTQQDFFSDLSPESSAFDLMKESLRDVVEENQDSDKYDAGLVKLFADFSGLFSDDIQSLKIDNDEALVIDLAMAQRAKRLQLCTPPPQQVMISGRLETIRHSDRMFMLITDSGSQIRGVAEGIPAEEMATLFGQTVLVHGAAQFRPSGSLLRIEASRIKAADATQYALWSQIPRPLNLALQQRDLVAEQGPRSGLNAVFGQWPGDESEEEFYAALEQA